MISEGVVLEKKKTNVMGNVNAAIMELNDTKRVIMSTIANTSNVKRVAKG